MSDSGIGIAADQMKRLFQPFFRCDPDVTVAGTGLGLYIAKAIAEAHGGKIWVTSQPGKGSTFSVALPLHRPAPLLVDHHASSPIVEPGAAHALGRERAAVPRGSGHLPRP